MKSLITRLVLASAIACGSAAAQPVTRFVVPFAAGGAADVYARLVASEVTEGGLPVIVDNKPGASGSIAADFVARSRADGLTVFVGDDGPVLKNTLLFEKLPYDPLKDFAPVTHIGNQPLVIVGRTDLPYSNLKEMVAYTKANPDKINRGSPGSGSTANIVPMLFERAASIRTTHVPFNGDRPAIPALLSGTIDIYSTTITSPLPHLPSGKIRVLGVSGNQRLPQAPDAPTFKEAGYDVVMYAWFVVLAPAGTPREAIERLNKAVNQVLVRENFIARARAIGIEPRGSTPKISAGTSAPSTSACLC